MAHKPSIPPTNSPITGANAVEPGIDLEALLKKVEFTPHSPAQWEYMRSNARFNIPCCGRRWGKSLATGHRLTVKSFVPDTYNWIVGPTYKLGEKEFRVTYNDFKKLGLLKYCKSSYSMNQGNMRIETPWSSIIEVVSAERPDSLLGEGLHHVVMSEAAKHARATWEMFIEPALSDHLGTADFPSTPKGYNWYHGLWELGQTDVDNKGLLYKSWQFPTWTNPVRYPGGLDNEEIQRIKSIVSKQWWDQEYGASFTSMTGAIYEEFDPTIHVQQIEYNPALPNYLAMDYGFANPFVALDCQIAPDDTLYVWREYHSRHKSTMEHGEYLKTRPQPEGYHVEAMWGDPRGADEAATLALVLGHVASIDVPWKHGVEQIKRMFASVPPKIIIDSSCTNLIRSISQLHVKEPGTSANSPEINENVGDRNIQHKVDDHDADALRYLVGPYYVLGAGSHLNDVYDQAYRGSESEDFFKLHTGVSLLDEELTFSKI